MRYPATLTPYEDGTGRYAVTFIDFPGCVSIGQNLDDALQMGADALGVHVSILLLEGRQLPPPSTLEEVISINEAGHEKNKRPVIHGTIYKMVHFEPYEEKMDSGVIRVTISLKPAILELIDKEAKRVGLSRSGFISIACNEYSKHR